MARVTGLWDGDAEGEAPVEVCVSYTVREWARHRESIRVELARMGPDRAFAPTTRQRLDALDAIIPLHVSDPRLRDWLASEAGQQARVLVSAYTPPPAPDPRTLLPALARITVGIEALRDYRAAVRGWPAVETMEEQDAYDAESRRAFVSELGALLGEMETALRRVRVLLGNPTSTPPATPPAPQRTQAPSGQAAGRRPGGGTPARRGATPR